jgi:hypothetical protein
MYIDPPFFLQIRLAMRRRHQLLKFILFCLYADLAREIVELTALLAKIAVWPAVASLGDLS